jgi:hypothetical protein
MTEEEAWNCIGKLGAELLPLNDGDPFEISVLMGPVQRVDEDWKPIPGEFDVPWAGTAGR